MPPPPNSCGQARLEETQAQYDRLLGEIDDAKRDAQVRVYKSFDDDAPILPATHEGTERGLSAEGGVGTGAAAAIAAKESTSPAGA